MPIRNSAHTPLAQQLRKNMTPEERKLWYQLLNTYPLRFRRQVTFGRFVVDFYCAKAKLVIELDGSQHFTGNGSAYDAERTQYLEALGLQVIRFTNAQINHEFPAVCGMIHQITSQQTHQEG